MLWACLFSAAAAALSVRGPAHERLQRVTRRADGAGGRFTRLRNTDVLTSPWIAAVGAALAVLAVMTSWIGFGVALGTAAVVHRWVAGLESLAVRRRRERVARDLPVGVDLLVAALEAGRPPAQALASVSTAMGGPLGADLSVIAARVELGADPTAVWSEVSRDPVLGPLGRSFGRAATSGASMTTVLGRCVEDLRRRRHTEANRVARSAGVRTAGPLGLCFLPAFIVVGVVPTVVGAFRTLVL